MRSCHQPSARLRVEPLEDRSVPAVLDLTTAAATGALNGAVFGQFDGRTVARGELDTFVKLDGGGRTTQGYNSDGRRVQFDEVSGRTHNHAVKVADLPAVTVNGVTYRQLVLDVKQPGHSPTVSLDELRLYVSDTPALKGYQKHTGKLGGQAPVYDLDAGGDNWVKLDARLNGHNRRGDMTLLVPEAVLGGGAYLSVYSKFGVNSSARCGEVSWSFGKHGSVGDPPPVQAGSISGVVYQDLDNSGTRDAGEPVAVGRVVWLDTNNNGALDAGEASTTTDATGAYTFADLAGNTTYHVRSFDDNGDYTAPLDVFVAPGQAVSGADIGLFNRPEV